MGKKDRNSKIAYQIEDVLYLNLTNRCSNHCLFCIRETKNGVGYDLWLKEEPALDQIFEAIGDPSIYKEVVFCGYGEPLMRAEIVIEVARWLKQNGAKSIRVNTNGLADLFLDYDIIAQMTGLIDVISISLNAHGPKEYFKLTQSKYGEEAYFAVLKFAKRCLKVIPKVILSVVDYPGVDLEKAAAKAREIGTEFRIRKFQGD